MKHPYTLSLIDASIVLELTISKLYKLFSRMDSRDREFWLKLSAEEENHSSVLESARDIFIISDIFPEELVLNSKEKIEENIKEIKSLIIKYKEKAPHRRERFVTAYYVEMSTPLLTYDVFMDSNIKNCITGVLQGLNEECVNHTERILKYIEENEIGM